MANVCMVSGESVFIPKGNFQVRLLKLIHQGRAENLPKTEIICSSFDNKKCINCENPTLMANGIIVSAPCKKRPRIK